MTVLYTLHFYTVKIKYGGINPTYKQTNVGKTVKFTCSFTNKVIWTYNGKELPSSVKDGTNEDKLHWIEIKNAAYKNSGIYKCSGVYEDYLRFESEAELKVLGMY